VKPKRVDGGTPAHPTIVCVVRVVNQPMWEDSMTARKTKILLDGGDADETQRSQCLIANGCRWTEGLIWSVVRDCLRSGLS
jgi:hypothetical protein